jgi:NAD-dependent deacetylase
MNHGESKRQTKAMTEDRPDHIVVFTGAGISAESGLGTFRGEGGLWERYSVYDLATPEAFERAPELVLSFYNERLRKVRQAEPNAAHYALARLEERYRVTVITQNVDDLHERAGSSNVIHLHGELSKACSSVDKRLEYPLGEDGEFRLGTYCERGSQLRPAVVWFGEVVEGMEAAADHARRADRFLVVGTSLAVFPAAGLVHEVRPEADKYIVSPELEQPVEGFEWFREKAGEAVPRLVGQWLS